MKRTTQLALALIALAPIIGLSEHTNPIVVLALLLVYVAFVLPAIFVSQAQPVKRAPLTSEEIEEMVRKQFNEVVTK